MVEEKPKGVNADYFHSNAFNKLLLKNGRAIMKSVNMKLRLKGRCTVDSKTTQMYIDLGVQVDKFLKHK